MENIRSHSSLELTKVNTYGLVYVWKGSDASLKPLLLLAHQDVVPVNPDTVDEWTHPPYSGYFDGQSCCVRRYELLSHNIIRRAHLGSREH